MISSDPETSAMSSIIRHLESIVPINLSEMNLEIRKEPTFTCRVRYPSENRSNGNIYEYSEDPKEKTFLRVKVHGCSKYTDTSALVVEASCVTMDEPYEPHIYRLSGKKCSDGTKCLRRENCLGDKKCLDGENCLDGKYYARVNNETMEAVFEKMNILSIKKSELTLNKKQKNFRAPYQHRKTTGSKTDLVDSHTFRLKFTLYLIYSGIEKRIQLGKPIVSRPIFNDRSTQKSIKIKTICPKTCSIEGGKEVMIVISSTVCNNTNTIIKIYEKYAAQTNAMVWESYVKNIRVYNKTTVSFIVPKYAGPSQINKPIEVLVQLLQNDLNLASNSISFRYEPIQRGATECQNCARNYVHYSIFSTPRYHREISNGGIMSKNMPIGNEVLTSCNAYDATSNEGLQTRNGTLQNINLRLSDYRQPNISTFGLAEWHDRSNNNVISENMQIAHDKMMAWDTFGHTGNRGLQDENVTPEQNSNLGSNVTNNIYSYYPLNEEEIKWENCGINNNPYLNNLSPVDVGMREEHSNDFPMENITDEHIFDPTGEVSDFQNYAGNNDPYSITFSQMHGEFSNAGILENMPIEHEVITSRNAFDATNYQIPSCSTILQSASNCQKQRKWDEEAKFPFRQRGC